MKRGEEYNPTQLLDYCKVDTLLDTTGVVSQILALVITERDAGSLQEKLKNILYKVGQCSIGRALESLASVADTGPELDFGRDGLDALTYHLSGHTCNQAINALKKVLQRFERDK